MLLVWPAKLRGWLRNDAEQVPGLIVSADEVVVYLPMIAFFLIIAFLGARAMLQTPGVGLLLRLGVTTIYLIGLVAVAFVRRVNDTRVILASVALALLLGTALVPSFAAPWSTVIFESLLFVAVLRLPSRWSLPIALADFALFTGSQAFLDFHHGLRGVAVGNFWGALGLFGALAFLPLVLRSRTVAVQRLQATQRQLRAEMARTAELAAIRERTRIAHDMHDVLAHSLTMLSMQVQAARQVIARDPERAGALLDDMAGVLRESIAESRELVSLLRTGALDSSGSVAAQARGFAERFGARTGLAVAVEECGPPVALDGAREAALLFAVREALTNAFRHGAAHHAIVTLCWEAGHVALTVADDGTPQPGTAGGGHGLRGMRERAAELGGTAQAGPQPAGGYRVEMRLPVAAGVAR